MDRPETLYTTIHSAGHGQLKTRRAEKAAQLAETSIDVTCGRPEATSFDEVESNNYTRLYKRWLLDFTFNLLGAAIGIKDGGVFRLTRFEGTEGAIAGSL